MNGAVDKISTSQGTAIYVNYILGAAILTIPRETVQASQTPDVWISMILAGVVVLVVAYVCIRLSLRYPGETIFQYMGRVVGKPIGRVLSIMMLLFFTVAGAIQVRVMAEVTNLYLLEGTPKWMIVAIFLWAGIYLIIGGINTIARMFEILLPFSLVIFVVIMAMSSDLFELSNLRPVMGDGIGPVMKGIKPAYFSLTGFECILIVTAFLHKPQKAGKVVTIGTIISVSMYLYVIIMVVGGLSIDGMETRVWPTLDLMRSFEKQGVIIERFESLLMIIWILQIFSTFTFSLYTVSLGLSQVITRITFKKWLIAFLPIVFLIAMLPSDLHILSQVVNWCDFVSLLLFGGLPAALLIISLMRKQSNQAIQSLQQEEKPDEA